MVSTSRRFTYLLQTSGLRSDLGVGILRSHLSGGPCNLWPMSQSLVAGAGKPAKKSLTKLQISVANAYGRGMTRTEIAKAMVEHLVPHTVGQPADYRLARARSKLRRWERNQLFRDRIYHVAITDVDLAMPAILGGVVGRAVRGRVDAARLALEITGRHNPKGEQNAPMVVVAIDGIQRPGPIQIADAEVVDEPS
jgi:hypothetical protein